MLGFAGGAVLQHHRPVHSGRALHAPARAAPRAGPGAHRGRQVLHAPRRPADGQDDLAQWLEQHLNAAGRCRALWVDLETAREQPDPAAALSTVLRPSIARFACATRSSNALMPGRSRRPSASLRTPCWTISLGSPRSASDRSWCSSTRPTASSAPAMVSFLTQLRHGYIERSRRAVPAQRRAHRAAAGARLRPHAEDERVAVLARHRLAVQHHRRGDDARARSPRPRSRSSSPSTPPRPASASSPRRRPASTSSRRATRGSSTRSPIRSSTRT